MLYLTNDAFSKFNHSFFLLGEQNIQTPSDDLILKWIIECDLLQMF